jgi:hypothetical protein
MQKLTKKFKTFKFPLGLNAYRKKEQSNAGNNKIYKFASSFLFQNAYHNGLIPTYFIADKELVEFFINSFRNSAKNILNDIYAKRLNYQNRITDEEILPQISGVLTFQENMKYSPILYFIEYSIPDKKVKFGIEINRTALTFVDFDEIDLIPEMTPGDKKYVELLLGFLLYKEAFPLSVKKGLLWNTPKFTDSKKSFISVVVDRKIKEAFKKSNRTTSAHSKVGRYKKLTSEKLIKKYGQIIYRPSSFTRNRPGTVKKINNK